MPRKFKQGGFCRRCLTSGTPVGGVCVIDDVEEAGLYVHHIPHDQVGSFYVKKTEVTLLKTARLYISNQDAKELRENRPYVFKRNLIPSWQTALNEGQYDVVVLNSPDKSTFILRNVRFWKYMFGEVAMRWETYLKISV